MVRESVKLDVLIVNLVRARKEITGVNVSKFFEQAAIAKLEGEKISRKKKK
jgi:hypothetical protein